MIVKKLNNKGAAMIAVLCLMAVFVTLCLAMLLTSSVLLNNAQSRAYQEQCRVSAVTMSKELEEDLCFNEESSIYKYIEDHIITVGTSQWPYYNTDELGHGEKSGVYKDFDVNGTEDSSTGVVKARMYWEWQRDSEPKDIILHIDITAHKNGQQHTVKTSYNLTVNDGQWQWSYLERT